MSACKILTSTLLLNIWIVSTLIVDDIFTNEVLCLMSVSLAVELAEM